VELNNRYFPSAENRGFELSVLGDVYRVAEPPETGTTQTSLCRLFSLSRTVVTVNATSLPSGDTAGALSVVTRYQSLGVKARGATRLAGVAGVTGRVWAGSDDASVAAIATDRKRLEVSFTVCSTFEVVVSVTGM
jgi:hypothetical protein